MSLLARRGQHWYRQLFRTIDVPADLTPVISTDTAECNPHAADLEPEAVEEIWEACENLYRSGVYPLLSLALRRRGKTVLNRSIGYVRDGVPATINSPICLFSASKAVAAVLVHLLAEQGHINLLNPVSYYIPAFAANGKGSISILHLLAHRGGIPQVPSDIELETFYDQSAALAAVCAAKPMDHLGRVQAYHAVTTGFIINELIRVTTGLNTQQYLNRYIRKPMGMRYFRFGLNKRDQARSAINTITGLDSSLVNKGLTSVLGTHPDKVVEMTNDPRFFRTVIPSANLFATAEEVSRFYQMLLDHGRWEGQQILDPLTVHRATRPMGAMELDRSLMLPMRYSAGFMLGGSPFGIYGANTQYAYGHLGYANIFCWADPERDIAVSLMNTGKLTLGPHLKSLPALIGAISRRCGPVVDMGGDTPVHQRA